jgi:SPP1 family holin
MKKFWEKLKTISAGTWIRTAVLLLALVNQVLAMFGCSPIPISDKQLTELLSTLFTIVAACVAWWKNNSFTAAAIEADKTMKK